MKPDDAKRQGLLRHPRAGARQGFRNPIEVWQTAGSEQFELRVHIVFDPPDGWLRVFQQEIGSAAVSVVGEAYAAGIYDGHSRNISNVGAMDMPIDRNRAA